MLVLVIIRSLIFNILYYPLAFVFLALTSTFGWFVPYKWVGFAWNDCIMPFFRVLLWAVCGLKIEIRGKQNIAKGGAIYASKHQSAMETYFLTSIIKKGATFIFKKELSYVPFFGWAVAAYGSIPVDRSGGSAAMKKMLDISKDFINEGRSIIIFPEGTRTKPGSCKEYKPGIAFIYQNVDAPVIPVALNTGFFWKKHSFLRYPGKVIFEFMKPIERNLDKREFIAELQNIIEVKCSELNAETIKNYPYAAAAAEKE
ncbi:MAG: 1-acyl-sn-glycerol-3-phosphate acyltransferase [Lactobacillaceae bacterium]|jgi:1-acyl-sn-glycerol-3-phosphate acyltransferase|nr:1-acyl-sn-glycerol-3-phosphate acyltransferase [Lactobacillaceae bacterium]